MFKPGGCQPTRFVADARPKVPLPLHLRSSNPLPLHLYHQPPIREPASQGRLPHFRQPRRRFRTEKPNRPSGFFRLQYSP